MAAGASASFTVTLAISSSRSGRERRTSVMALSVPGTVARAAVAATALPATSTLSDFSCAGVSGVLVAMSTRERSSTNAAFTLSVRSITGSVRCTSASPETSQTSVTGFPPSGTKRSPSMSLRSHSPLRMMKPTSSADSLSGTTAMRPNASSSVKLIWAPSVLRGQAQRFHAA